MSRLVLVSRHAVEQFLARWPQDLGFRQVGQLVAGEVAEALDEGRYSTREPKWAQKHEGERSVGMRNGRLERDRTLRYVWTAKKDRVYLVDKSGAVTNVVTAISPPDDTLRR